MSEMPQLTHETRERLREFLSDLVDQEAARVIVEPQHRSSGFWFGGGNLVADDDGVIWLVGRYRNRGDSRTGLEAGQRGLECALFRSDDGGASFAKIRAWSKAELSGSGPAVLSIEGTSLHRRAKGTWELFVSSEKDRPYPPGLVEFQKPGTGVWSIDVMTGATPDTIDAGSLTPVIGNRDEPGYLHVKDPVVSDGDNGETVMILCTHPFSWASGNTGLAIRQADADGFGLVDWEMVHRGPSWDVASTRVTARLRIPRVGCFAGLPPCSVYFHDGAECMRELEQNSRAKSRPRGYSCEELGGALFGWDAQFPATTRLSPDAPLFISPHATGCSRYVECLRLDDAIVATWQQAQPDGSQPLVANAVSMDRIADIFTQE